MVFPSKIIFFGPSEGDTLDFNFQGVPYFHTVDRRDVPALRPCGRRYPRGQLQSKCRGKLQSSRGVLCFSMSLEYYCHVAGECKSRVVGRPSQESTLLSISQDP